MFFRAAVAALLIATVVNVAFGGVSLPPVFVQYTNTYTTSASTWVSTCSNTVATWAANINNQQFAFNSSTPKRPVRRSRRRLAGLGRARSRAADNQLCTTRRSIELK